MKKQFSVLSLFLILSLKSQVFANIVLPSIISDNILLQQNAVVNIWGMADAGEKITVVPSWAGSYATAADCAGCWMVKVKTPKALVGHSLLVKENNIIKVNNILAGEDEWYFFFRVNLYNKAGLPATPFRNDNWNE